MFKQIDFMSAWNIHFLDVISGFQFFLPAVIPWYYHSVIQLISSMNA